MGTAPPSKPVETPTRPFDRNERRICLTAPLTKKKKMKKTTTLFKLIARRDWQKVLIRASLFPNEISKKQRMEWYGVKWNLLPLHLACALKPPPQVIAKLLEHHADTAKLPMFRTKPLDSTAKHETGAFPSKLRPHGYDKKQRRNFARLSGDKDSIGNSISFLQGDIKSGSSPQKPSPSKTLPTAHDDLSISPPHNTSKERTRRRGKLAGLMTRSIGGFKGKNAKVLFPSETSWSEEPSFVKNASFQTTYSSLPEDTTIPSPSDDKARGKFQDDSKHYYTVDENLSWAPSAVGSSYSLDEGNLSLEDSLPDEYMEQHDDGSESSLNQFLQRQGAFLQLSLTGGLCIAKLPKEIHVPRHTSTPAPTVFSPRSEQSPEHPSEASKESQKSDTSQKMTIVDLDALLERADEFLPLHIACLYRASPQVLKHLLDAYPLGTQVSNASFGMLPVHMVCACLSVPTPTPAPKKGANLEHLNINDDTGSTANALETLLDMFPEGRLCPSQHNGMTPFQYVQASMEDGYEKKRCLEMLSQYLHGYEDECMLNGNSPPPSLQGNEAPADERDSNSTESSSVLEESIEPRIIDFVPSEIQYDDSSFPHSELYNNDYPSSISDCDGTTPLYLHLVSHDWDSCLHVLSEDPEQARKWHYGINISHIENLEETLLWKRLPIHDACAHNAPPQLIKALIASYPGALARPDPHSGYLPLHMACRCDTIGEETIIALIDAYPEAAKTHDLRGCLPLHLACMARINLGVIKYLVASHPEATWTRDCSGKVPVDYARVSNVADRDTIDRPEVSEDVTSFLESLPSEIVAPKHRRDCANIISDGSESIIRNSQTFPSTSPSIHRPGKEFHFSETEI